MKTLLNHVLVWALGMALSLPLAAGHRTFRIGVLANRGAQECISRWNPTAQALSRALGESCIIIPLGFREVEAAVAQASVDYVIVNTSQYVALERNEGVQRIATLKNRHPGRDEVLFGSVIFTRADRPALADLLGVRGKHLMAVEPDAFGGWLAAARELKASGLEAGRDFRISFGGTQEAPIQAVLEGRAEVGVIRTDLLEALAEEGRVRLNELRVLPPPPSSSGVPGQAFPFLHSTRLYPEWPFAKLKHTSREDAERMLVALLSLKADSEATVAGRYGGWTIPLNYQGVNECLIELRYGPYAEYGRIGLWAALQQYWPPLLLALVLLVGALAAALRLRRLNRSLENAMAQVQTLRGLLPICAWCKRIRDDKGEWTQVEAYVHQHSKVEFTHGVCPECAKKFKAEC